MVVPRSFTDQLFGDQAEVIREQFSNGADIGAFQSMPFVLIKRGNRTRSIVDQYFSRYYFKPKLILETENTVTTLAMAQAGVGITICPELFLRAIPAASASSAISSVTSAAVVHSTGWRRGIRARSGSNA